MTAEEITYEVARKYGFQPYVIRCASDIRGAAGPHKVRARDEAMAAIRRELKWSYPKIGRYFGGRHHTTVMAAIKRVGHRGIEAIGSSEKVGRRGDSVTNRELMREIRELRAYMETIEALIYSTKKGLSEDHRRQFNSMAPRPEGTFTAPQAMQTLERAPTVGGSH